MMPDPLQADLRHHLTVLRIVLTAPVEVIPLERQTESSAGRLEEAYILLGDLLAKFAAWNDRYAIAQ